MSEYKTWRAADVSAAGPLVVGRAPLPPALQGVFWLQNQGDSSSIMSFGKTNDGGGVGGGALVRNPYMVRCAGDRAWAFSDKGRSQQLVNAVDLIYKFYFDDLENPRRCQIFPHAPIGITLDWPWLLDFDMHLVPRAENRDYPSSVVWRRVTHALGREVTSEQYDLVQILDGDGNRLQPAFFEYTAVMKTRYCGTTPGVIHYRECQPAAADAQQQQQRLTSPSQQLGSSRVTFADPAPTREVRALCCAINWSYTPGAGIAELPGAVADTQSVALALRARYAGANVRLLVDDNRHDGLATKREVLGEIDRLVSNITPGRETLLFFCFAGHGTATTQEWRRSGAGAATRSTRRGPTSSSRRTAR